MDLLADELDDFAPKQLSINKQFADKYKAKKQGEELSKREFQHIAYIAATSSHILFIVAQ